MVKLRAFLNILIKISNLCIDERVDLLVQEDVKNGNVSRLPELVSEQGEEKIANEKLREKIGNTSLKTICMSYLICYIGNIF